MALVEKPYRSGNATVLLVLVLCINGFRVTATDAGSFLQANKEVILGYVNELTPKLSESSDKTVLIKPGAEVSERIEKILVDVASRSPELRTLVVETLIELLENPAYSDGLYYSAVWYCASQVLAELKAVEAVDVLSRHLEMEHGHASLSFSGYPVVHALIQIGEPAVAKLEDVLLGSVSSPASRALAAFALGEIGGTSARLALERASRSETHPDVMERIRKSLAAINKRTLNQ